MAKTAHLSIGAYWLGYSLSLSGSRAFDSPEAFIAYGRTPLHEIITGRPRPRHLRFASAVAELLPGTTIQRRDRSLLRRLWTNAARRLTGIRQATIPKGGPPVLLHQALTSTRRPYATEFDVPLAVHGYSYQAYLKHGNAARGLLEAPIT